LDGAWLRALVDPRCGFDGSLLLAGPQQELDPAIATLDRVHLPGAIAYRELPQLAALADVLVMPYTDSPATRAMQPLKLKEYLLTTKPVVARNLPALHDWSDAADLVADASSFAHTVAERVRTGALRSQLQARQRVLGESWPRKAAELEALLADCL
jgi:glycosyltransferase involved in cell wall biosynthesis